VHAAAKGSEDADAPVSQLVAGALDDDVAIIWNRGGYDFLVGEETHEVFGGLEFEIVLAGEAADGGVARHLAEFPDKSADALAEFERTAGLIAVPEGHLAGFAGRG
jgi:hypothetical protein